MELLSIKNFFSKVISLMKGLLKSLLNKLCIIVCKSINKFIESIFSPQVLSVIIPIILGICYHPDITDIITNTQARMLLQKDKMNRFENQMAEIWIATQNITFLFNDFSYNKENKNSETINKAYKHWEALMANWRANFSTNYQYISSISPGDKIKKYCLKNKEELFTNFEYQFKCIINKIFEEKIFNKLENCYKNYYLKNKSCKSTLPAYQEITQLNKEINKFYLQISKSTKGVADG